MEVTSYLKDSCTFSKAIFLALDYIIRKYYYSFVCLLL